MTVAGTDTRAHTKRADVVLYVNGIALGVLEHRLVVPLSAPRVPKEGER